MLTSDTVVDLATGLTWQRALASGAYTWAAANAYCSGLSLGGAGVGRWRLPRKLEVESLVVRGSSRPAVDTTAFPNTPASAYYWSSSANLGASGTAWNVYVGSGSTYGDTTSATYSVRCVH